MVLLPEQLKTLPDPTWIVERVGAKFQFRYLPTGDVFDTVQSTNKNDAKDSPLTFETVLSECVSCAGLFHVEGVTQVVKIDSSLDGVTLRYAAGGNASINHRAYWNTTLDAEASAGAAGGWNPIRDLAIVGSGDNTLIVGNQEIAAYNNGTETFTVSHNGRLPFDEVRYRSLCFWRTLLSPNGYCYSSSLGNSPTLYGKGYVENVRFSGPRDYAPGNPAGPFTCKMGSRQAYRAWVVINCRFDSCEEHNWYGDAIQGDSLYAGNFDLQTHANGRSCLKVVERASQGQPFLGGPPSRGTLTVRGNVFRAACLTSASGAVELSGLSGAGDPMFQSGVIIENNDFLQMQRGCINCSVDQGKGVWFTNGLSIIPSTGPWPCDGTAFCYGFIQIEGNYFEHAADPVDSLPPIRVNAFEDLRLGANDYSGVLPGERNIELYGYPFVGAFDGLKVTLLPSLAAPLSSNAGLEAGKWKYGSLQSNSIGGALLTTAQIDNIGTIYPPLQIDQPYANCFDGGGPGGQTRQSSVSLVGGAIASFETNLLTISPPVRVGGRMIMAAEGQSIVQSEASITAGSQLVSESSTVGADTVSLVGSAALHAESNIVTSSAVELVGELALTSSSTRFIPEGFLIEGRGSLTAAPLTLINSECTISSAASLQAFRNDVRPTPAASGSALPQPPIVGLVAPSSPASGSAVPEAVAPRSATPNPAASGSATPQAVVPGSTTPHPAASGAAASGALLPNVVTPSPPAEGSSAPTAIFPRVAQPTPASSGSAVPSPSVLSPVTPSPAASGSTAGGEAEAIAEIQISMGVLLFLDYSKEPSVPTPEVQTNSLFRWRIELVHSDGPKVGKSIPLPINAQVEIRLQRPNGDPLHIPGELVSAPEGLVEAQFKTDIPGDWSIQARVTEPGGSFDSWSDIYQFQSKHNN